MENYDKANRTEQNRTEQLSLACKINLALIEMHTNKQDYSLKEFADTVGVNKRTICRYFAEHLNISFSDFKRKISENSN